MADKTRIEWTEATWNVVTGCNKVSAGCKNCYAERDWARLSRNPKTVYFNREFSDVQTHDDRLSWPAKWKRPRKIFVNSMSDLFHDAISDDFIISVFSVMQTYDHHIYQILTKRPERMRELLRAIDYPAPPHIWIGVSAENQETANERIPILLDTPAGKRWISAEPLLGPIEFAGLPLTGPFKHLLIAAAPGIDWVVAGGESGPNARTMDPDWVRSLRDQCAGYGIPFLFKQWGEYAPNWLNDSNGKIPGSEWMDRIGKKKAGRVLDGQTWDQYPI